MRFASEWAEEFLNQHVLNVRGQVFEDFVRSIQKDATNLEVLNKFPIETAPPGKLILVWGTGGWLLGIRDELGNWRGRHHGTVKYQPKWWHPLPPKAE